MFYQLGTFFPFMRAHGHIKFHDREPYLQSPKVQEVIRQSLELRYDLSHYLYTQFYLASTEGTPIMRPLWMEYSHLEDDG
jgi:mannosyl-oligosaccharide alpha-1,3-glucosidase